jgi:DNA-binding NarL/FixJ family response regulator
LENVHQTAPVRDEEVLCLLALCYTNKEIAEQLQTNVETVAVQKAEAMKKLGLRSRIDVIRYAEQQGWLGEISKAPVNVRTAGVSAGFSLKS